jgi:hypothetical protein
MKTKEEIEQLAEQYWDKQPYNEDAYVLGYTQCQEDMAKSIEDAWVKYREITNNEDAWSFKKWLVNSLNNQDNEQDIHM